MWRSILAGFWIVAAAPFDALLEVPTRILARAEERRDYATHDGDAPHQARATRAQQEGRSEEHLREAKDDAPSATNCRARDANAGLSDEARRRKDTRDGLIRV